MRCCRCRGKSYAGRGGRIRGCRHAWSVFRQRKKGKPNVRERLTRLTLGETEHGGKKNIGLRSASISLRSTEPGDAQAWVKQTKGILESQCVVRLAPVGSPEEKSGTGHLYPWYVKGTGRCSHYEGDLDG